MAILGLTFWIIIIAIGTTLLATAKDNALAAISGMFFVFIGSAWVGFYYAMLMGW